MFKAKIRSEVLKEVIDVIATQVDEVKFTITTSGINAKAVDPAHVAMVDITLDKGAFEEFKAKDTEMGINIEKLREVVKLTKSGETIAMELDEDHNRLVLSLGNITRNMSLVDTAGMSDPKIPGLNLAAKVTLELDELRKGLRAAEPVADHIALIADENNFELRADGDTDFSSLTLVKDQLVELSCKEKQRSLFSLDYFLNMIKAVSSAQNITLEFGNDFPVSMDFTFADSKGKVSFLLAPRIEND